MAADKKRGMQTARDMVLSLALIVLAAWVIYLFIPHDDEKKPVKAVGYRVEHNTASRAAPYPVLAPEGLPEEWRATSVRYGPGASGSAAGAGGEGRGAVWHLGFLTPDEEYVALEQSDRADTADYIGEVTEDARDTGKTVDAGGKTWKRYEGEKYDALVRTDEDEGYTTVVTGTAPLKQQTAFADRLEPGPGRPGEKSGEN